MANAAIRPAPSESAQPRWGPVYAALLREWLARGETAWLPIVGDSMAPILPLGTRIRVAPADGARLVPGDVVLYEADGAVVCHRMLRRAARGDALVTRGDSWRAIATRVPAACVLGRVVAVERRGVRLDLDTWPVRLAGRLVAWWSRALDRIVPPLRTARWMLER